jgi:polo-like kinase 1
VSGESKQAPRAPLSPLPANLPARAAGRLKARGLSEKSLSEKSERRAAPALAPPAQPAAFDVLEAQDVRAFDEHHSRRSDANRSGRANPKPRRAAEEGAPRSNAAGKTSAPSVPSAPPASPSRRNVTVTSVSGRDAVGIPTSSLISVRAAPSAAALMSAGAESSSSLADDDEDVGARVADCIGGGDSAGAAERRRAASASAANVASIATFPPVWVTKWVDYTSKYGLGYRLSDGTFGVVFNDATKMSQASPSLTEKTDAENEDGVASASLPPSEVSPRSKDTTARVTPPGDRLEYRERARRGSGSNPEPPGAPCVAFSAAAPPPSGLEKKTKLMRHFRGYLARDGRSAVERSAGGLFQCEANGARSNRRGGDEREKEEEVLPRAAAETARAAAAARARDSSRRASVSAYLPHVKNWLRTKHAILFRLSNRTIQVNFTDGSEILLSSEAQACVFVDPKTGKRDAHLLAKLPADPELLRRLRYVKEVLHQLVHRAE